MIQISLQDDALLAVASVTLLRPALTKLGHCCFLMLMWSKDIDPL
ncbi:hypothetical protein [uncultured Tateyamaria sp.]|nr:hypothetical protein [uncultured Tateyamaria sp.]